MPALSHNPFITRYHEEGNWLRRDALETAFAPTPQARATTGVVSFTTISFAVTIPPYRTPNVVYARDTICGLPKKTQIVNNDPMSKSQEYIEIGQRLRQIRHGFSDLNQKEWAALNGISESRYNNWENGTRRIPVDDAEMIADRYGLTLDFIYRGRRDRLPDTFMKSL